MSLLTIVQDACKELKQDAPSVVVTSTDPAVLQMLSLVNDIGQELASGYDWPQLYVQKNVTTVAAELQGDLETLFGTDFNNLEPNTLWQNNFIRPIYGNMTPQQYQFVKVRNMTGPYSSFRIQMEPTTNKMSLYLIPAPTAGDTISVMIRSKNWVSDSGATTRKSAFTADSDLCLFDDRLLRMGLVWRWRMAQRLDYLPEQARFKEAVETSFARTQTSPNIRTDRSNLGIHFIDAYNSPEGNYG